MGGRRRLAGFVAGLATVVVLVACSTPSASTPLPPIVSVGDPIIGVNPPVAGEAGARTTVMTYGPWTVPAAAGAGHDQAGMKEDVRMGVARPCTDCYITAARPRLRYRDGREANTDTGLWLHHFALLSSGAVDTRCGGTVVQLVGEVLFTGANERTQGRFPAGAGYRTRPLDRWSLLVDLMNTGTAPQDAVFEVAYEWVPASTPDMHAAKPIILDVGQACIGSEVPAGTGRYSRASTWTATAGGRVMGLAAHVHDGGTHVVVRNLTTGEQLCDSTAHYGGPGFEEPEAPGGGHPSGHGGHSGVHVSGMDQCVSQGIDRPLAVIHRGDRIEIEAFYDADLHPHSPDEKVMGLAFLYLLPE